MRKKVGLSVLAFALIVSLFHLTLLDSSKIQLAHADGFTDPKCTSNNLVANISSKAGTEADPYLISSDSDLVCMAELVGTATKSSDVYFGDADYWQITTASLDLGQASESLTSFPSIGGAQGFKGVISGTSSTTTISNMKIFPDNYSGGLFSSVQDASISYIAIENSYISDLYKAGSFIAKSVGSLTLAHVSSSATLNSYRDESAMGGLIGLVNTNDSDGPNPKIIVEDAVFSGQIDCNIIQVMDCQAIGGIIGSVSGTNSLFFNRVYNYSQISGVDKIGGLIGEADVPGRIENSGNYGLVLGINIFANAGGIIGYSEATVPSLYKVFNSGSISAEKNCAGLIAKADNKDNLGNQIEIELSGNFGRIFCQGESGGLVGQVKNPLKIVKSVNYGSIVNYHKGYSRFSGANGGIVGHAYSSVDLSNVTNAGTVSNESPGYYTTRFSSGIIGYLAQDPDSSQIQVSNKLQNIVETGYISPLRTDILAPIAIGGEHDKSRPQVFQGGYFWNGLSSTDSVYSPFSGTSTNYIEDDHGSGPLIYQGKSVGCSEFTKSSFWTGLGFSPDDWDLSKIGQGYAPILRWVPQEVQRLVPFYCSTKLVSNVGDMGKITPISGEALIDYSYRDSPNPNSAAYFYAYPANTQSLDFTTQINSGYILKDIVYNSQVISGRKTESFNFRINNSAVTPLLRDDLILLANFGYINPPSDVVNLEYTLASGVNLSFSWSTTLVVSGTYSLKLTNTFGKVLAKTENKSSGGTWSVGQRYGGTFLGVLNGTVTLEEGSVFDVSKTVTIPIPLYESKVMSKIKFPDVQTKTSYVRYKGQSKTTAIKPVDKAQLASIKWMAAFGISQGSGTKYGTNQTTYRPQDKVTRGQMAQFLARLGGMTNYELKTKFSKTKNKFTDITKLKSSASERYYAILWLVNEGITTGCNAKSTKFCPTSVVNRGSMAQFLQRFTGAINVPTANSEFPDVSNKAVKIKYQNGKTQKISALPKSRIGAINWAKSQKITIGSSKGKLSGSSKSYQTTFRPQDPVTRASMAVFIHRIAFALGATTVKPQ